MGNHGLTILTSYVILGHVMA